MKKKLFSKILLVFLLIIFSCLFIKGKDKKNHTPGFYKTIFWDRGKGLDDSNFPVFRHLDVSCDSNVDLDEEKQRKLICGNQYDLNGILLYPDNTPRYQVLFTPGGDSRNHGIFLTEKGRENIRIFFRNGGSYVGICGGAAIASLSRENEKTWPEYYHLWPGYLEQLNLGPIYPNLKFEGNSDLLSYFSGLDKRVIQKVSFTYGSYPVNSGDSVPPGTKTHMRFDLNGSPLDGEVSCWSYKPSVYSGTMVAINCHPEVHSDGEQLELTKALFLYAMDGIGKPRIKGKLIKGEIRKMNLSTLDRKRGFTKIGDGQIHHFVVELKDSVENLTISLTKAEDVDFNIFVNRGELANPHEFLHSKNTAGTGNLILLGKQEAGNLYIGIHCLASVSGSIDSPDFLKKNSPVLSGTSYELTVDWQEFK